MMKRKPTVGQQMFALNVNNNARGQEQRLRPVRVIAVGRKYFKALPDKYADRPHFAVEYEIDSWLEKSRYTPDWKLYESEQEYDDEVEFNRMSGVLREYFNGYGKLSCSLEALRIAYDAINESIKPNTQRGDV